MKKGTDKSHNGMESLPIVSILRGPSGPLTVGTEPVLIHKILENTIRTLESNNNDEKIEAIHSINLADFTAQDAALIDHTGEKTNFTELNESANKLARAILNHLKKIYGKKLKPNSDGDFVISVAFNPSKALVITLLAIWKIGAAYLPLDHAFPINRVKHILHESEPVLVIADFMDGQKFENRNAITYSDLRAASLKLQTTNITKEETLTVNVPDDKKIAIILYTSGSTGTSKGVRVLHTSILNRLKWQWKTFPFESSEKICIFKTAYTFVDSVCEVWGPLCFGRSLLIVSKEDTKNAEKLIELLEKFRIYRIVVVPSLLNSMLVYIDMATIGSSVASIKAHTNRLPDLRLCISSGETLSKSVAEKFFSVLDPKDHKLCNFYGSTEVMGDVSYWILEPEQLEKMDKVPIGRAVDNCCIYLLNQEQKPVKTGEIGEIWVSGCHLTPGYVKKRDAARFMDNTLAVDPDHSTLYRTGDYARMIKDESDGQYALHYEGRTDSQIKVRGYRVDLSEVEAAVAKIHEIDKFAVLTYRPGEIDQALLAYVHLKPSKKITEKDIETKLQATLTSYQVPRIIIIDHMPLLVNGKIDRQLLLQKYESEFTSKADFMSKIDYFGLPKSVKDKAQVLFETIATTLGPNLRGRIHASANFFSLGGNSLNSVLTVAKLRDAGYIIGVDKFITATNLLEIASRMTTEGVATDLAEVTHIPDNKYKIEMLADHHIQDVKDIIAYSFEAKSDLEKYLNVPPLIEHYHQLVDLFWPFLIKDNLSFVVRGPDGTIKSAALNLDASEEPEFIFPQGNTLEIIFEFLAFCEVPAKRKYSLPEGKGRMLHNEMAGVRLGTPPDETIEIFFVLETELLRLAKERGFSGVFSTNTNPLTQQLARDVHSYQMLEEVTVRDWVDPKGEKPFSAAPEEFKIHVCYRSLD